MTESTHKTDLPPVADLAPEPFEVPNRQVVLAGMGLLLLVAIGFVLAAGVYKETERRPVGDRPGPLALQGPVQPAPHLQVRPSAELERLRAREDEQQRSYGWIDRERGIIRIPIERAMKLLAEQPLPARNVDGATPPAEER